jgi:hypothetical protein
VSSRSVVVLDEGETVQRVAAEGIWIPSLRPAPERWLSLSLVVDESPSMAMWHRPVADLRRLLEHHGAFRDVRTWGLTGGAGAGSLRLYAGPGPTPRPRRSYDPSRLLDATGRHLILVVSDCTDPAWYDGRVAEALALWGRREPVAVVQPLPERLWLRSALGAGLRARLHAPWPGAPNARLLARAVERRPGPGRGRRIALPVMTLEASAVKEWARALAAGGGAWATGRLVELDVPRRATFQAPGASGASGAPGAVPQAAGWGPPAPPRALLRDFDAVASPTACRLATLLAAVPLRLPVMRLVQARFLPGSGPAHLAEFFLSGLLREETPRAEEVHPDEVDYEFVDGVRDLLLDRLSGAAALEVIKRVSAFVEREAGQARSFAALLDDPGAAGDLPPPPGGVPFAEASRLPFARVTARTLRRLGGDYARLADRLAPAAPPAAPPVPAPWLSPAGWPSVAGAREHFVDREAERDRLRAYLADPSLDPPPLVVLGPAGIGKSALLGRLMQDCLGPAGPGAPDRFPVAYLNLREWSERGGGPGPILLEILRQIGHQYPEVRPLCELIQQAWFSRAPSDAGVWDDLRSFLDDVAPTITTIRSILVQAHPASPEPGVPATATAGKPLVLLLDEFDTFVDQPPVPAGHALEIGRFLAEARRRAFQVRPVIASRTPVTTFDTQVLRLGELGETAACALLAIQGIDDPSLALDVYKDVGGAPNRLLTAAAARRGDRAGSAGEPGPEPSSTVLRLADSLLVPLGQATAGQAGRLHDPTWRFRAGAAVNLLALSRAALEVSLLISSGTGAGIGPGDSATLPVPLERLKAALERGAYHDLWHPRGDSEDAAEPPEPSEVLGQVKVAGAPQPDPAGTTRDLLQLVVDEAIERTADRVADTAGRTLDLLMRADLGAFSEVVSSMSRGRLSRFEPGAAGGTAGALADAYATEAFNALASLLEPSRRSGMAAAVRDWVEQRRRGVPARRLVESLYDLDRRRGELAALVDATGVEPSSAAALQDVQELARVCAWQLDEAAETATRLDPFFGSPAQPPSATRWVPTGSAVVLTWFAVATGAALVGAGPAEGPRLVGLPSLEETVRGAPDLDGERGPGRRPAPA